MQKMFKHIVCIIALSLTFYPNLFAQLPSNSCTTIYTNLGNGYRDVSYVGSKMIVIGAFGKIVTSDDEGESWRYIQSGTNEPLNDIQMVTESVGYIAGEGGELFKTEDGGNNWFRLRANMTTTFVRPNRVYFLSPKVGYNYGNGSFLKTTDGGKTWEDIASRINKAEINDMVFISESVGFLCGSGGALAWTVDAGKTWKKLDPGGLGSAKLTSIVFINPSTAYLADDMGDIMKSIDGGATWSRIGIVDGFVRQLLFIDEKNAYAITSNNSVHRTMDGGVTWKTETVDGSYAGFSNIVYNTAKKTYVGVGHSLIGFKSNEGNWIKRSDRGFVNKPDRVFFPDDKTGYLFQSSALNFKTIDGGVTWKNIQFSEDYHEHTTAVHFFNKDVGLYTSEYNIFRTTDGAKTWSKPNISDYSRATAMTFVNDKVGYLGTDKSIYKTVDAGLSWKAVYELPNGLHVTKFQFPSINVGYSLYENYEGTPRDEIYKTVDQGVTWKAYSVPGEPKLKALYFFDEQTGFVAGYSGFLYKTENGGESWTKINTGAFSISNISFHDRQKGYINSEHKIFETNDGGQTWGFAAFTRWDAVHWATVNGETYILDLDGHVTKIPKTGSAPLASGYIQGNDTVYARTTNIYKGIEVSGLNYTWTISGSATIASAGSEAKVNFDQPGEYTLTATPSNLCGTGASRSLTIKVLPAIAANNFSVDIRSASCKGSNNGSLNLKALQAANYKVIVKNPAGLTTTYAFTNELMIPDLLAGNYDLTFTIEGNEGFSRNQRVVIEEPKDLSVYSSVRDEDGVLHLDLEGSEKYYIELDHKTYQTTASTFELKLSTGLNKVRVYTDKICQGVFEKNIMVNGVEIYPNPVVTELKINPGTSDSKDISVEIRNILGTSLLSKSYPAGGGTITIDMSKFSTGTYLLTLKQGKVNSVHKIIKQ